MSTPDAHIKLVEMAKQIADFFAPYPDTTAIPGIAKHINQFWTPQMRENFLEHYRLDDPALPPRVGKALPLIKPGKTEI
jgi:formate dehydrogenase subunit delta